MSLSDLASGFPALQWQGCGGGKLFLFPLEMATMARTRHKSFKRPKGDAPPSRGERETWPRLFRKPNYLPGKQKAGDLQTFQSVDLPVIYRLKPGGPSWMRMDLP